ncbi:hypothetical protein ACLMO3_20575 [Yersinia enterocolitica]
MCQSHDKNSAATPAGEAERYSRDAAESICQKTDDINDKYTKKRKAR